MRVGELERILLFVSDLATRSARLHRFLLSNNVFEEVLDPTEGAGFDMGL